MPAWLSRDELATDPQGRVLTAAGHSGFGQVAEDSQSARLMEETWGSATRKHSLDLTALVLGSRTEIHL